MNEHKIKMNIPENHTIVQTKTEWKVKGSLDTDTYWYDELDENENIVSQYILKDSTNKYPPFDRNITYEKA